MLDTPERDAWAGRFVGDAWILDEPWQIDGITLVGFAPMDVDTRQSICYTQEARPPAEPTTRGHYAGRLRGGANA